MKCFIKKQKLLFTSVVFISLVVSTAIVLIAFILQNVVDSALQQNWSAFQSITVITVMFLLAFGIVHYLHGIVVAKFLQKMNIDMRGYVVDGLVRKNLQDYSQHNTSFYLSTLTNDIKQIEDNYLKPLINIIQNSIMFILSLAALFYLNAYVTIVLLVCVVIMFIAPSLLAKILENKQNTVSKRMAEFTNHIKDFLEGFEVLYSYRVLRRANKHFQKENEKTATARFEADHVNAINNSLSNILGVLAQFAVILVSGYLIIKGELTGGTLIALVQLSGSIVSPVVSIFTEVPKMKSVKSIVNRIIEIGQSTKQQYEAMSAQEQEKEQEQLQEQEQEQLQEKEQVQEQEQEQVEIIMPQEIKLNNVQFSYEAKQKLVLIDINLNIELGKKYAIIGESGCGKSTLVKLIAGHYMPTEGELLIDGTPVKDKHMLTSLSAMVSQKVFLFNTTVKHNIGLYEQFSKQQWEIAVEKSGINKFVDQIENGIDSYVGEGGSALSGGQRQRISIARALIRNKAIVILDEGTSALDIQTSYEIESNLIENEQLTLLTITHQINEHLLKRYDGIIYMEAGQIVESGTYDELIEREGRFKAFTTIVHAQEQKHEKEAVAVN